MKNKLVLVKYERNILTGESTVTSRDAVTSENLVANDLEYEIRDEVVYVKGSMILSYTDYNVVTEQYNSVVTVTEDSPVFEVEFKFNREDDFINISILYNDEEWLTTELPLDFEDIDALLDSLDSCFIYDFNTVLQDFSSVHEEY